MTLTDERLADLLNIYDWEVHNGETPPLFADVAAALWELQTSRRMLAGVEEWLGIVKQAVAAESREEQMRILRTAAKIRR